MCDDINSRRDSDLTVYDIEAPSSSQEQSLTMLHTTITSEKESQVQELVSAPSVQRQVLLAHPEKSCLNSRSFISQITDRAPLPSTLDKVLEELMHKPPPNHKLGISGHSTLEELVLKYVLLVHGGQKEPSTCGPYMTVHCPS